MFTSVMLYKTGDKCRKIAKLKITKLKYQTPFLLNSPNSLSAKCLHYTANYLGVNIIKAGAWMQVQGRRMDAGARQAHGCTSHNM